jgi:CheY-like chemotaxis protein
MSAAQIEPCGWILVVDDDDELRQVVTEILEDYGHTVREARNGREALDLLRASTTAQGTPCVILLDLMMPVMDGVEFRQEQLLDQALASVPTVIFSADRRAALKARAVGAVATLEKPVHLHELMRVVTEHCRGAQALGA